jgi:hypothetical protein
MRKKIPKNVPNTELCKAIARRFACSRKMASCLAKTGFLEEVVVESLCTVFCPFLSLRSISEIIADSF